MRVLFEFFTLDWEYKHEQWEELDIIPAFKTEINLHGIVPDKIIDEMGKHSDLWDWETGTVEYIALKKDEKGFYYLIEVGCDDAFSA